MSLVNVTNITVRNNVCPVTEPLVFQIEFECLEDLKHDVEWKIIYVTSDGTGYVEGAEEPINVDHGREGEIVLDAVCLGPIYRGVLEFEFRVAPPDFKRLNADGILGMQAVLVTANYCDQEFIRIGYYTNNCYEDPELRECPPDTPNIAKMVRCIIDSPRVTRFPIKWDSDSLLDLEGNELSEVINDGTEGDTVPVEVSEEREGANYGNVKSEEGDDSNAEAVEGESCDTNVDNIADDFSESNADGCVEGTDNKAEDEPEDVGANSGENVEGDDAYDTASSGESTAHDGRDEDHAAMHTAREELDGGFYPNRESVKRGVCEITSTESNNDGKVHRAAHLATLPTVASLSEV
ncbi:anti-silencing protein, ASF1 family protein [Babesia caballi]|uniref:Anti-silencing protein, ASF1 family protein n=1 Tax=Babesia caballi TaxID=5871 RepID=A0AAV4LT22_BABCB|nr:anti-silencing protein, ASF1 family protein [Babesia caballi]